VSKEWEDRYTDMCRQAADLSDRNRELTTRLDAAERLVAATLDDPDIRVELGEGQTCTCHRCEIMREVRAAISPTPAQPAAGEERTT